MPTLEQATSVDTSELREVERTMSDPTGVPLTYNLQEYPPNPNPFLRCPLPPIDATTDSIRQYYLGGLIPQTRIIPPPQSNIAASGSVTNNSFVTNTTASTPSTPTTTVGTTNSSTVTTPSLLPQQAFSLTIPTSRSYVPLIITTSVAARVELYSTASFQAIDFGRPATVPPGLGTEQGLLLDVFLDTAPFVWFITPAMLSANADSPQTQRSYITVTNLNAVATLPVTVALRYLILQP